MVKIVFVRHGESMNNVLYSTAVAMNGGTDNVKNNQQLKQKCWEYAVTRREADPSLSSIGFKQAQTLKHSKHAKQDYDHTLLVCSPMRRAILTMEPVCTLLSEQTKQTKQTKPSEQEQTAEEKNSEKSVNNKSDQDTPDLEDQQPLLKKLKTLAKKQFKKPLTKLSVCCHGMYFEEGGCHVLDKPLAGRNPQEIVNDHTSINFDTFIGFDNKNTSSSHNSNIGWYNYGTGKETKQMYTQRIEQFYMWLSSTVESMSENYDNPRIMLFGHGLFMSSIMLKLLGMSAESAVFAHANTGITTLEYSRDSGAFFITGVNDHEHLRHHHVQGCSEQDGSLETGGDIVKNGWTNHLRSMENRLTVKVFAAGETLPIVAHTQVASLVASLGEFGADTQCVRAVVFDKESHDTCSVVAYATCDTQQKIRQLHTQPLYCSQVVSKCIHQALADM